MICVHHRNFWRPQVTCEVISPAENHKMLLLVQLNWVRFMPHSTRSFRRRSSQPISWLGTETNYKPNKMKLENTKPKWSKLTHKNTKVQLCISWPVPQTAAKSLVRCNELQVCVQPRQLDCHRGSVRICCWAPGDVNQYLLPARCPAANQQAGCPSCHPTNSVKALKANNTNIREKKRTCSTVGGYAFW